jgi:hypothetical protein
MTCSSALLPTSLPVSHMYLDSMIVEVHRPQWVTGVEGAEMPSEKGPRQKE